MSKRTLKLIAFSVLLSILVGVGCRKQKKRTDRTLTVPQATVSVKLRSVSSSPKRSKLGFLTSPAVLDGVSEDYFAAFGAASKEEFIKDLESWVHATAVDDTDTVFRLEVRAPSAPVGAAILRGWIDELTKSVSSDLSTDELAHQAGLTSRLIQKNETEQIELNRELRADYPSFVRVEADAPADLVNSEFRTGQLPIWSNLLETIQTSKGENRFNAVAGLVAVEKFQNAKLDGIQIKGSLRNLQNEMAECVLSWEALDERRARKLTFEQVERMQAALEIKIGELGPEAPEVASDQRKIKALIEMTEIQDGSHQVIDEAENEIAYLKIREFLDEEAKKFKGKLDEDTIAKVDSMVEKLISTRSLLESLNADLKKFNSLSDPTNPESTLDYRTEVVGKIRTCAAKKSDFDAYEKLREEHVILPEIKFIIRQ